jgi:hypothetical protein
MLYRLKKKNNDNPVFVQRVTDINDILNDTLGMI